MNQLAFASVQEFSRAAAGSEMCLVAAAGIMRTMIAAIEQHREEIAELCRRFGVRRLELFGSAAAGTYDPTRSDYDFFFEFNSDPTRLADRFFGLAESLEALLGSKVDLVSREDVRNPYFLQVADRNRVTVYAA